MRGVVGTTVTITVDEVDGGPAGITAAGLDSAHASSRPHFDDLKPAHSECRHEHKPESSPATGAVAVLRLLRRFSCLTVVRPRPGCTAAAAVVELDDVISGRLGRYSRVSDVARRLFVVSTDSADRRVDGTLRTTAGAAAANP